MLGKTVGNGVTEAFAAVGTSASACTGSTIMMSDDFEASDSTFDLGNCVSETLVGNGGMKRRDDEEKGQDGRAWKRTREPKRLARAR